MSGAGEEDKFLMPVGGAGAGAASSAAAGAGESDAADAAGDDGAGGSRKRAAPDSGDAASAADDKKARERKRVLRNRELARVSNERRKMRIKQMEGELQTTRQTVASLEESIRSLEAENGELKGLLENKS